MTETYYTVLDVSRTASATEIKTAYRELMRQVHPDAVPNASPYWKKEAEEKSKEINEAYQVLSNPGKRRLYDQQLDAYYQREQTHQHSARNSGPNASPASGNPGPGQQTQANQAAASQGSNVNQGQWHAPGKQAPPPALAFRVGAFISRHLWPRNWWTGFRFKLTTAGLVLALGAGVVFWMTQQQSAQQQEPAWQKEARERLVAKRIAGEQLPAKKAAVWIDPATRLMWAMQDNGSDVNWNQADDYCRNELLGGYSDWRLPTIDELETIYDKRANSNGASQNILINRLYVKGQFHLSGFPWSSNIDRQAWYFSFGTGRRSLSDSNDSNGMRALCVRRPGK